MPSLRIGGLRAVSDKPPAHGPRTVRLVANGVPGDVIGSIDFEEALKFWVAYRPDVDGSEADYTTESTATLAVGWPLKEHIGERSVRS